MNYKFLLSVALISLISFSCKRENIQSPITTAPAKEELTKSNGDQTEIFASKNETTSAAAAAPVYATYLIRKGQHYSDLRPFKSVSVTEMKFYAKFDQSAIYQTSNPQNQYDINKLWGFSEGFNNQYNSARIGWGYSNGAIRLYGYVYRKGARYYSEIISVLPGQEVYCSIRISGSNYIISANGVSVTLPRGTTVSIANGFQQYPYFGGDEVAPHNISIFIKPA